MVVLAFLVYALLQSFSRGILSQNLGMFHVTFLGGVDLPPSWQTHALYLQSSYCDAVRTLPARFVFLPMSDRHDNPVNETNTTMSRKASGKQQFCCLFVTPYPIT